VTRARALLAGVLLVAVVLQATVVARLPLPGAPPDLVLVVVVAVGLLAGPRAGLATGFAAGLLADLTADHAAGRLAAAYLLAGGTAARIGNDLDSRVAVPALAGAAGALVAVTGYAAEGVLLGDPRVSGGAFVRSVVSVVPYCAALTPVVVPAVAALLRRAGRRR
jgi:rod shape-determining protein MreD